MKRKLLGFLMLFAFGYTNAQIIDIPDANFKSILLSPGDFATILDQDGNTIVVDANNNGEIEQDEALQVYQIMFLYAEISSFEGLQYFTNLTQFDYVFGNIAALDLTVLPNLESATCSNSNIQTLVVSGLQQLVYLSCGENLLTDITLNNLPALKYLLCNNNLITSLDITDLPLLQSFIAHHNQLTTIDLSASTSLTGLSLSYNLLTAIDLSPVSNLTGFDCGFNMLTELDITPVPNLTSLYFPNNQISVVDFSGAGNLGVLNCKNNLLTELELGNTGVALLECAGNQITHLNLKNGVPHSLDMDLANSWSGNPLATVCADEDEIESIYELLVGNGYDNVAVSSYCTFTPGGNYNTVSGNFTFDIDNDGCDDSDVFSGIVGLNISDGTESGTVFTGVTGNYVFYTQAGAFTLAPEINADWFTVNPLTPTVTFADNNNNEAEQNFCVSANGEHNDMEVVVYPVTVAQPGFNATYRVVCRNGGNQLQSGYFTLTYDDAVFDFVQSNTAVSASPGSITWGYTDLLPFHSRTVFVTLNLNSPTEDPAVNIQDELMLSVALGSVANDENPDNNSFDLYQTVVGSYDPNDSTCIEGEALSPEMIGEYLHYNIRFENTGTAPATFVVVKDTINEEQFDVSSLEVLYASHPMQARLTGNVVEFYFDNINLAANGGKGNVLFKIRSLETLTENDFVAQEAAIYFDYNWPVITNEYVTTFDALSTDDFAASSSLKIFPNPTSGIVNISSNNEISSISVYDIQGRLLQDVNVNAVDAMVNLESNPSGVYLLKINGLKGSATVKVVKQ